MGQQAAFASRAEPSGAANAGESGGISPLVVRSAELQLGSPAATTPANTVNAPIRIERMEVHPGHLVCRVAFGTAPRVTSPELMARVLPVFPTLPQHACVNEQGTTFAAVMDHTPLPHLLEHLVVDLQVLSLALTKGFVASSASSTSIKEREARRKLRCKPIVGTSEWLNEQTGTARLDISFADDLIALQALRDAVAFLNSVLQG